MKLKKLIVATPSSSARITGLCRIQRSPVLRPPDSRGAPGGSSASTRPRKSADQRNVTASSASA
jgi:hypothetical protein